MPDQQGKLTGPELEKIAKWLQDKARGDQSCPVCRTNAWAIAEQLVNGMPFYGGGSLIVGGPAYPIAMLVCQNCAHVRPFMAVPMLGMIEQSAVPSEAPKKGPKK